MVGWLNYADIKEETHVIDDDFDPLKEWLVDPDPMQLQNPCDYINFRPEPCGQHYSVVGKEQEDQIFESSIDLKMEKVSLFEISGVPQGGEVGSKENGGGSDGEINCVKPGLEASKSDRALLFKENASEGKSEEEEESTSTVAESHCRSSSSDESSSDESSSEESSSDESISDDEDDAGVKMREEAGEFEEGEVREVDAHEIDILSDEEEDVPKGPIRSKHEVKDLPPVPKVAVSLQSHHQLLPVGVVLSVMMNRVIVEGSVRHNPLDEGSILWVTDSRTPLGLVDEIFGPVKNPYYVVRYNTEEEVPTGVEAGISISFVVEFACQILNQKDLCKKGYDASGDNDEEVDNDFDFSDDEKEALYKKSLHQGKRAANDAKEMKRGIRTRRRRNTFTKTRIQQHDLQKQQTCAPLPIPRPHPTNLVAPPPASFMGQSGIHPGTWNSSSAVNANSLAPFRVPEFPQAMPAVNFISNSSQQLSAGLSAPSRMPEIPQAMQAVNFLSNSSQQSNAGLAAPSRMPEFPQAIRPVSLPSNSSYQLSTLPQEAPWLPAFSPQLQNTGFQGDLQMQVQNQNLIINNLVNMMALQQQLQQLIPPPANNLPWFGAAPSQQPSGQNNFAPRPFVNGFVGAPGPQVPGNAQIRCQGPPPFAPYMQFNAGNPSSLNSNGGNSRPPARPFHRGGGRFIGRGGRQPNR